MVSVEVTSHGTYYTSHPKSGFYYAKEVLKVKEVAKKLMEEEIEAIYSYDEAIKKDPDNAELYKHIMQEEVEHYEELKKIVKRG